MRTAVIKVKPAHPDVKRGGKRFFHDLLSAVKKVRGSEWHQLAEFPDKPTRAYWYSARLKRSHPTGYEFCATTTDGVGRVYCRRVYCRRTPAGA